ncbi:MAG: hypothetical protein ACLGIZ_04350 [Acidimicrobiia bacterium]
MDDRGRQVGGVETFGAPAATGTGTGTGTDEAAPVRWAGAWRGAVVALVLAGVALRLVFVRGRWGTFDSDEAIVGLMARSFLEGEWRAFYWGQHYGGTLETALVALAGASTTALKLVPAVLSGVVALLTWRVARRVLDDRLAQAAGLLCWVAPGSYVWWSTKERGFYWVSLSLGLALLLAAQRLVAGPQGRAAPWWPWLDGTAFGLVAGLGFWTSPNVLYFAVPACAWLLLHRPGGLRWLVAAVPAAVLGALPWLWHNVENDWLSLQRPEQGGDTGYLDALGLVLWRSVPMVMNLRYPISQHWLVEDLAPIGYLAVAVLLVVAVVRRRKRPALPLLGLAAFPFIYAWFPGAGFVGEGRYAVFVVPFLAVVVAWLIRHSSAVVVIAAVSAVLSFVVVQPMGPERPRHLAADLAALRAAGIDTAWGEYWVSYRLGFASGGWLEAASWGSPRGDDLRATALADRTPAFIFRSRQAQELLTLEQLLDRPSRRVETEHFTVLVVDGPVDPALLPPGSVP